MKQTEKHRMIIELPVKVKSILDKLADKDNRKLKPYVEKVLIEHSENKK